MKNKKNTPLSRENIELIFSSLPDLYLILNAKLDIVFMTDSYANTTNINKEKVIGRNIFDVFPDNPDDKNATGTANLGASLERVITQKTADAMAVQKYDVKRSAKEGGAFEERYWSPLNVPVLDADGNVIYIIHRVEEVTTYVSMKEANRKMTAEFLSKSEKMEYEIYQRAQEIQEVNKLLRLANQDTKIMAAKADEANRMKSEFLANMSHELRTPLNGIIGFSELMYNEQLGPISTEHKEYLSDILTSSHHLLQLINDVLDLAKVETGKMELHPIEVDLKKLVSDVKDVTKSLLIKKKLTCEVSVDQDLKKIVIDPSKFKQILYNYLSNAIKFSHDNSCIKILLTKDKPNHFRLSVTDHGLGIKKTDLKNLFVEFMQLDSGSSKNFQGTGLGLALTKKIVSLQGGEVGVESEYGKGSTFYAVLPCIPDSYSPNKNEDEKPEGDQASILIIEDENDDRNNLLLMLKNTNYSIHVAKNGYEALAYANSNKYDAITLDLILPDMSGWDVLKNIRTEGLNKHTPIVVTTIVAEKDSSMGLMVNDYLVKPVAEQDLIASIERSIATKDNNSTTILVVDDDRNSLKLAKHTLMKKGYHVICKKDGESGLNVLDINNVDVIILDLLMPNTNGFEFIQKFRTKKSNKHIPVIVWSEKDLTSQDIKILNEHVAAIVKKGAGSTDDLLVEVERYLSLITKVK